MSNFSGFSEADIRKLQNGETITSFKLPDQSVGVTTHKKSQMVTKPNKKQQSRQDVKKLKVLQNKISSTGAAQLDELPNEAKLIKINLNHVTEESSISTKLPNPDKNKLNVVINKEDESTTTKENAIVANDKKCIDLGEFQIKQKHMEEQNRLRKNQIAKALEDRTKRTLKEQQKLVEIQNEFKKLDATLSDDVKILRKEIEGASYEYMEAQKKYNKIEKDFLAAKFYLHQKLEKKEMLTEHLCTIIEKNEERKADKLNELLLKLDVLDGGNLIEDVKVQDEKVTSNQ